LFKMMKHHGQFLTNKNLSDRFCQEHVTQMYLSDGGVAFLLIEPKAVLPQELAGMGLNKI